GSTQTAIVRPLVEALNARHLFFYDSVTSGRTVGYAVLTTLGLPPRINNAFLDHYETDADSRDALFQLATVAARQGSAIGICHVFHPYLLHALQQFGPQLEAKGYAFVPIADVTNRPAGTAVAGEAGGRGEVAGATRLPATAGAGVAVAPTAAAASRSPWQPGPQAIGRADAMIRCTTASRLSPWARRRAATPVTWAADT